jgi:hypothetical protein
MLTKRPFLLTTLSLLTSYAAAAQTAAAPAGPQPTDILSWLAGGLAVVVLIFGLMTATSLAAVAADAAQSAPADNSERPATLVPEAAAEANVVMPAPAAVPTEQVVAA